jgi:flagellar hook-basal body complex protein FliE
VALKQDFQQIVEKQLAVWQEQTKEYQERLAHASTDARAQLEKAMAGLRDNTEQAKKLLGQVQQTSEQAWKDVQGASQKAFAQLQEGWANALKRFF